MSLQLDSMTESIWVTADGRRLAVAEMEDDHLRNTICFLRRHAAALKSATLVPMGRYQETAPDGAYDAIDIEIDYILALDDEAFLLAEVPPYRAMLREAIRRGLVV